MTNDAPDSNRRPLKSRGTRWSRGMLELLLRRGCTPNGISLAGIGAASVAGAGAIAALCATSGGVQVLFLLVTATFVQLRLLCNMLDGMLAVEGGLQTPDGPIFNELPDRLCDILILGGIGIGLDCAGTVYVGSGSVLALAATVGAVMTAYVRAMGAAAGTPHFFQGPMAKPHRMALLTGALLLGCLTNPAPLLELALMIIVVGTIVTCVRRTARILAFLRSGGRHPG